MKTRGLPWLLAAGALLALVWGGSPERIAAGRDQVTITVDQVLASGFTHPVQITNAGDGSGRLFVVEQPGTIRVIKSGAVLPTPFLDLTALTNDSGEQGLLGLAFHPDFASNGWFYVDYTRAERRRDPHHALYRHPARQRRSRSQQRDGGPDDLPALHQPQRRSGHVWPRRLPLHRHGRWRVGRRSPGERSEPRHVARRPAAPRRDQWVPLRHPARQPLRGDGGARRGLGHRPAQPLALQLRPRDRRPLHRRRGAESLGGDRLPARRHARRHQLRLELHGGLPHLQLHRRLRHADAHRSHRGVRPRRRQCRDRRLRLPRRPLPQPRGSLLLRRLRHGQNLEPRGDRHERRRPRVGADDGPQHQRLRRGRGRRALRRRPRRHHPRAGRRQRALAAARSLRVAQDGLPARRRSGRDRHLPRHPGQPRSRDRRHGHDAGRRPDGARLPARLPHRDLRSRRRHVRPHARLARHDRRRGHRDRHLSGYRDRRRDRQPGQLRPDQRPRRRRPQPRDRPQCPPPCADADAAGSLPARHAARHPVRGHPPFRRLRHVPQCPDLRCLARVDDEPGEPRPAAPRRDEHRQRRCRRAGRRDRGRLLPPLPHAQGVAGGAEPPGGRLGPDGPRRP